ncbi:DUF4974 domain-containing protein [Danxiaibacter flavus]|uniref:DUF4974 domain-containing protein n=2 Tax=Danxiaibacter flavus TaxID=3049108 RepID=A0ABV3ZC07_9BACT
MDNDQFLLLVSKHMAGTILPEETELLQKTIETDSNYKEKFVLLEEYCSQNKQEEAMAQYAFDKILARIKNADLVETAPVRRMSTWRKIVIAGAAAAVVIMVVLVTFLVKHNTLQRDVVLANKEIHNDVGKQSMLTLDDGTKIWLNERSKVSYNDAFGKTRREIYLSGEAFFDVAKNEHVPLVIHARNIDIRVKGTAFNVSAYNEDDVIETSLIRGIVEVVNKADADRAIILKPNEKLVIKAVNSSGGEAVKKLQDEAVTQSYTIQSLHVEPTSSLVPELSWMNKKLVFYKESFDKLVEKMERRYLVKIHIVDADLKQQKFTGVFDTESLDQALKALQYSYYFKYSIKNKEVFITKN